MQNQKNDTGSKTKAPYSTTTRGIRIDVEPKLNKVESNSQNSLYVYNYTISITNEGKDTVQLISRHWIITDGFNKTENVQGLGVIGQQPVLQPGEHFQYTSFCPLPTPTGKMRGTFQMKGSDNQTFDATIGEFRLADTTLVN